MALTGQAVVGKAYGNICPFGDNVLAAKAVTDSVGISYSFTLRWSARWYVHLVRTLTVLAGTIAARDNATMTNPYIIEVESHVMNLRNTLKEFTQQADAELTIEGNNRFYSANFDCLGTLGVNLNSLKRQLEKTLNVLNKGSIPVFK